MPDIINKSESQNYVCGNKIFILGSISSKETSELIGNISNMVDRLQWQPVFDPESIQITNPYKLPTTASSRSVIDIYINSNGGTVYVLNGIIGLLNLARAKGAIIRTNVLGTAYSCASVLALQGTPNFRIMNEMAIFGIHYGSSTYSVSNDGDIDNALKSERNLRNKMKSIYQKNTNIPKYALDKMMQTEHNDISSEECLKLGICDWILTNDGKFVNRNTIMQKTR